MAVTQFVLITDWRLAAPLDRVWALIEATEEWPDWWCAVKKVELIAPGDDNDVGAVRRLTWGTALPYTITFDVRTTRVEPQSLIEGRAFGELDGVGLWTLREEDGVTHVRYDWRVEVTKPWMRLFAPVLRPMFAWNHDKVMGWGYEGAVARLGLRRE
jgi:uncharacterized protein YndB with AHSA1/START domain